MEEKFRQESTDIVKVVLFGPESTGKTTLSEQLARHYNSVWVPEYAREYLQNKWNNERKTCEPKDLLPIAEGQIKLENKLSKKATKVLICDTDLLETKVYSEAYYVGNCDPILERYALENSYDLYLLTYIDVPWEADDLRDKPGEREEMFNYFKNTLIKYNRNFVVLKGSKKTRLATAVDHIDKILKEKMNFSKQDLKQLEVKGISKEKVLEQIETFKEGIQFVNLSKAAIVSDGILRFSEKEQQEFITLFEAQSKDKNLLKFVPASGAASRMFKALFNFLGAYNSKKQSLEAYLESTKDAAMDVFANGLKDFPFYTQVKEKIGDNFKSKGEELYAFVSELLSSDKLDYGFYPKGLLPFHKYEKEILTPFAEHLKEASLYTKTRGKARLHFTISEQHKEMFVKEYNAVADKIGKETNTIFQVDYSYQKSETDTVAVDLENNLFRLEDNSLLFRPSGHGALIENLNEQDADIIFIKNIDNVVVSEHLDIVANSKKVLAGFLIKVQSKAFKYAELLNLEEVSDEIINEIKAFLKEELNSKFKNGFTHLGMQEQKAILKDKLNRPIRVCGMVKNEGEPGGGPFWIRDYQENVSLQIIESAQIDKSNKNQSKILQNATHFNPVDLVCGVKNYKGEKYDLLNFVNYKQGFITEKTKEGKALKALETPGLWNGAMAFWNTIFVEVPLITFNPVKTVNDLLKPAHQTN